jgi:hypothetical protein
MEETMNRRAFLVGTAATATATAVTVQAATAATEGPFGTTGVPVTATVPLPLGPLSGSRYPDPHIEVLDRARYAKGVKHKKQVHYRTRYLAARFKPINCSGNIGI